MTKHVPSPHWNSTVKLIFGLTIVTVTLGLLFYLRAFIGPLLLAFVATYLLHPVASWLDRITHLSWRVNVALLYLVLLLILIGLSTWLGVAVVNQVDSLYEIIVNFIYRLPELANQLSSQKYVFGPFEFELGNTFDLNFMVNQLLQTLQPILGRTTSIVGGLAARAVTTIALTLFILLISYFLLAESGRVPNTLDHIHIPGYEADVQRITEELGRIWNAFFRGQLLIMLLVTIVYAIVMSVLGVRFAFGIAVFAGIARFVPYLGSIFIGAVTILATFFQPVNHFGLQPLHFTILVIVIIFILDQILDSFVVPMIMGQTLRMHPAAILVGAIIATSLIGIIGIFLAAPVMASLKLFGTYAFAKMFDLDPWPELEASIEPPPPPRLARLTQQIRIWWRKKRGKD